MAVILTCCCNHDWITEELKKFERRNDFIIEKYKDLKYTRPEDAEMILEES